LQSLHCHCSCRALAASFRDNSKHEGWPV